VVVGVDPESLECCEDDKDGGPAVVEGEGEVDKELIIVVFGRVMFFDNVIDMGYSGADEKGEDESDDVMLTSPEIDVDGVEDSKEGEAPGDGIDDDMFSGREELVDDCPQEEEMD